MSSLFEALILPASPGVERLAVSPESLNCLLPRRAEWTTLTRIERRVLINLGIGVVLLCVFLATRNLERLREFHEQGVTVTAHITGASVGNGRNEYRQNFEYRAGDRYRKGWRSVSSSEYRATLIGDTLTITYLSSKPEEFLVGPVGEERIHQRRIYWGWVTAFWAAVFVCRLLWSEVRFRQQRFLLREGIAITAQITDVQSVLSGRTIVFFFNYCFEAPGGVGRVGRQALSQEMYRHYRSHPDDRAITVLYDKQNPRRSQPYAYMTLAELSEMPDAHSPMPCARDDRAIR